MTCFSPIQGYESVILTKNRKHAFTLNIENARRIKGKPVTRTVKCRKCEGCRNDDAKEKAVKILFEAQITNEFYPDNCSFITLTYKDEFLPLHCSLDYSGEYDIGYGATWTNFIKRLRFNLPNHKIRFFMVGEYGSINLRPHYHAIIFGYNFPDKYEFIKRGSNTIYRSPFLEKIWTVPRGRPQAGESLGYCSVGSVTFDSACYVARYSMKKDIGTQFDGIEEFIDDEGNVYKRAKLSTRYVRYHRETGEKIIIAPERNYSSNGGGKSSDGGIGSRWFDKYYEDIYRKIDVDTFKDYYEMPNGKIVRPPHYFDKKLELIDPSRLDVIKQARQDHMSRHVDELTEDSLARKREYFLSKTKNLKRSIGDIYNVK